MHRIGLLLILLAATLAQAQTHPGIPATQPAVPPEFSQLDMPMFLKSFTDTFKDDLVLVSHSFARNNTSADESRAPYWLILHVRPRHDGFYVVRYDVPLPPAKPNDIPRDVSNSYEYYFTIGKPNTKRLYDAVGYYALSFSPLANAGDTVLLPIPYAKNDGAFSKTGERHPAKGGQMIGMSEIVAERQRKEVAALDQLPKQFPADDFKITNHAEPNLVVLGTALGSMSHAAMGQATDSCAMLLEARQPGDFVLEVVHPAAQPGERMHPPVSRPLSIVPANQPITVLLTHIQKREGASSSLEFHPYPDSPDLPTPTLRVGDFLTVRVWEQVVAIEEGAGQPHKVVPPPIALEKKPFSSATKPAAP